MREAEEVLAYTVGTLLKSRAATEALAGAGLEARAPRDRAGPLALPAL